MNLAGIGAGGTGGSGSNQRRDAVSDPEGNRSSEPTAVQPTSGSSAERTTAESLAGFRTSGERLADEPSLLDRLSSPGETLSDIGTGLGNINERFNVVERGLGVVTTVGGVGEMALGAVGVVTPEPLTTAGGVVLAAHGADTTVTGLRQIWTGEFQQTGTEQLAAAGARTLGASDETADNIGMAVDIGVGMINPSNAARRGAQGIIEDGAREGAERAVPEVTEEVVDRTVREGTGDVATRATGETGNEVAGEVAERGTDDALAETGEQAADDAVDAERSPESLDPTVVQHRIDDFSGQGHAPQRHGGDVTEPQLDARSERGVDPATGTSRDYVTGNAHKAPRNATSFTSDAALVHAEDAIRQSDEFAAAVPANPADGDFITVRRPLEDVFGSDYQQHVQGRTRVGSVNNPQGTTATDLTDGRARATYEYQDGNWNLVTLFPEKAPAL